jgi:hypothetical protein
MHLAVVACQEARDDQANRLTTATRTERRYESVSHAANPKKSRTRKDEKLPGARSLGPPVGVKYHP